MNGTQLDSEREVTGSVSAGMIEPRSMIGLLRARTAEHHHGLESGLGILHRLSEAATRGPLIAGYFSLYRATEAALRPHLSDMPDLAFCSRVRSRQIPDKAELPERGKLLVNPVFPAIGTKAEALGALYVLDGSTLGGRKILQALRRQGRLNRGPSFSGPLREGCGRELALILGNPRA